MKKYAKYIPLLEKLVRAKDVKRSRMLKECDPEVVRLVCEAVFKVLKGKIKLTNDHYKKLSPYKRTLLFLASKRKSLAARRNKLLDKRGGAAFLPFVLPAVISLISSLM